MTEASEGAFEVAGIVRGKLLHKPGMVSPVCDALPDRVLVRAPGTDSDNLHTAFHESQIGPPNVLSTEERTDGVLQGLCTSCDFVIASCPTNPVYQGFPAKARCEAWSSSV